MRARRQLLTGETLASSFRLPTSVIRFITRLVWTEHVTFRHFKLRAAYRKSRARRSAKDDTVAVAPVEGHCCRHGLLKATWRQGMTVTLLNQLWEGLFRMSQ